MGFRCELSVVGGVLEHLMLSTLRVVCKCCVPWCVMCVCMCFACVFVFMCVRLCKSARMCVCICMCMYLYVSV